MSSRQQEQCRFLGHSEGEVHTSPSVKWVGRVCHNVQAQPTGADQKNQPP